MIFWRVLDDKLYAIDEVDKLGFETEEGLRIPDEYLDNQEFVILRTCHGIGDWGIIASLPRLLKAKYPNCKVYVPSKNLIKKLFNIEHNNAHVVFDNNPYVDDFVDSVNGEIFHDHYRIYDKNNIDVPLAKQMLKFWQFTDFEMDYETLGNNTKIKEMYAIGPAISLMMEGYIVKDELTSLKGTLVPATTVNKTISKIPMLGEILVGKKIGEGVFGVSFKIKGPPKKLKTSVNPIKTLTPRFITRTLEKISN